MIAQQRESRYPYLIAIQIAEPFQADVDADLLRRAARVTLDWQGIEASCELSLVVTDDVTLHDLNRRYRHVDAPTDVLAFAEESQEDFVPAPEGPRYLGDVIISFPQARQQATEAEHTLQAELQLLTVHGVLHLLGYDDMALAQRKEMWAAQADILGRLGGDVNLPD